MPSKITLHRTLLKFVSVSVAALLTLTTIPTSQADLVTYDVSFSANTFFVAAGANLPPVNLVTGSFDITLDPTLNYTNVTTGISLKSLNIALDSPLSFTYKAGVDGGFSAGTLRVGGLNAGSDAVIRNPSTNDFWLYAPAFATVNPTFSQLGYTQTSVSTNNLFQTLNQTGSVSVTAVPEPSGFAIFGIAFVAALVNRKRKWLVAGAGSR